MGHAGVRAASKCGFAFLASECVSGHPARMCGRYRLKRSDAKAIADMLGVPINVVLAYIRDIDDARWNIAPQEKTPPPIIYRPAHNAPPQWSQSIAWGITLPDRLLINAKVESAKVHKANISTRRCLVPAHGYYKWFATAMPGSKGKPLKVPCVLHLPGEPMFHFAGFMGTKSPTGSPYISPPKR
jgi:putative SOS response-associated peptidase YedK